MDDKKPKHQRDRHKRGVKLFFIPKLQGQKHKHKKNKYYVSHHDHDDDSSPTGSIMSGDSPLHNNRTSEAFDFSSGSDQIEPGRPRLLESKALTSSADGRTSPVASGSKDVAVQNSQPINQEKGDKQEVQASVIVEPGGKDKNDDEKDGFGSPTLNNDDDERGHDKEGEERRRGKNDDGEFGGGRDKKDRKDEKFKKNGNVDKLDGVFSAKGKKQKKKKDDEDDCMVKCLYVTMTCCECSIM